MIKNVLSASLLLLVVSPAMATFDLMFIPSTDGQIYRYDPENDVRLGNFGLSGPITDMAIDPTTNKLAVIRENGSMSYDSSTGALLGVGISDFRARLTWNSSLNRFDAFAARYVDGLQVTPHNYSLGPSITVSAWNYLRVGSGALTMSRVAAPTLNWFAYGVGNVTSSSTTGFTDLTYVSPFLKTVGGLDLFISQTATSASISRIVNAGPTATFSTMLSFSSEFDFSQPLHMVNSHTGIYIMGKNVSSSDWRIQNLGIFGSNSLLVNSRVISGLAYHNARPAIIIAPEPGTMVALGLGLAAILRRRKAS